MALPGTSLSSTGYPDAAQHSNYHASLLIDLTAYCAKAHWVTGAVPVRLIDFLWSWITLHIDSVDRELVLWLQAADSNVPDSAR